MTFGTLKMLTLNGIELNSERDNSSFT